MKIFRFAGIFIFVLFFLILGIAGSALVWLTKDLPDIKCLEDYSPPLVSRVFDKDGELVGEFFIQKRFPVELSRIPDIMVQATIAIEDRKFYRHWGVDIIGIMRAVIQNIKAGRTVQGASTITQQLARNLFLTQERTVVRKLKEILLAIQIERRYSKDEILHMYFNQIYYGNGAYGIEASALSFFGKHVDELNLYEAALLAALPKSPIYFDPFKNPEKALVRRNVVLNAMEETGAISEEEAERAKNAPLSLNQKINTFSKAPYFIEEVRRRVIRKYGENMLYRNGLDIYTTLDSDLQEKAIASMEWWLRRTEKMYRFKVEKDTTRKDTTGGMTKYIQGAVVAIEAETGAVTCLVGGRDFEESEFNRATQAKRQPGSAFKPFVYTACIDNGFTPSDEVLDIPIVIMSGGVEYSPANYDHKFKGPVTIREALALSRNLAAVRLIRYIGEQTVVEYARRMGIKSELKAVTSLALGACEVTPLEITGAYSVFPNLGVRVEPYFIERIEQRGGDIIYEHKIQKEEVIAPATAFIMTHLMRNVIEEGTAIGVRLRGFSRPAAGKTGTTDDFSDAWFVGFTPDIVCGVWVGFDTRKRIVRGATGANFAVPLWTKFMDEATRGKPVKEFKIPKGVVSRTICNVTHKLANEYCPHTRREFYIAGTEPTEICDVHTKDGILSNKFYYNPSTFEKIDRETVNKKGF
jgi:penicillin-binding protein 1A